MHKKEIDSVQLLCMRTLYLVLINHINQMEKKSKQSLGLLKKADKDYTEAAYLAESARQDWDMTVARVSAVQ